MAAEKNGTKGTKTTGHRLLFEEDGAGGIPPDAKDRKPTGGHKLNLDQHDSSSLPPLDPGIYTLRLVAAPVEAILGRNGKCDGRTVARQFEVVHESPLWNGRPLRDGLPFPDPDRKTAYLWREWEQALGLEFGAEVFPEAWVGRLVRAKVIRKKLNNKRLVYEIKGYSRLNGQ